MTAPLVSIVMPSRNQQEYIGAAVDSVLAQDYRQLELIVADGGSTDGTPRWLEAKQRRDPRLRCVSEPDAGPADAVNKGLQRARGTIIGWLNSDDLYTPCAVQRAVDALQEHADWLMVYGHGEHIDGDGRVIGEYPTLPPSTPVVRFSDGCFICQPTVFFRRTMVVILGELDSTLATAFDFDYWLRAFSRLPGRIGFVDAVQAQSRLHAECITTTMRHHVALEGMRLLSKYLGGAPCHWALTHVNELLGEYAAARCSGNEVTTRLTQFLQEAKEMLATDELARMRKELSGNAQLQELGYLRHIDF